MCRKLKILPFAETLTRVHPWIAVNLLAKRVGNLSQYIQEDCLEISAVGKTSRISKTFFRPSDSITGRSDRGPT
jgi:hypothetical protein